MNTPTDKERDEFYKMMSEANTDEEFLAALYKGMEDPNDPAYNAWLYKHKPVVLLERKTVKNDNPRQED